MMQVISEEETSVIIKVITQVIAITVPVECSLFDSSSVKYGS